ncbi:membrane protein [Actinoplanes sp. SE50]|uniref:MFS transporter n=1 Tax=unclassified Actinoplanes TaxID=2626549 RepID=UPI00023EC398|nr:MULTISPECIES: MFS transporter [unclassified Actinoplanes]AEV88026.1 Inner membrane protein ybjJ [Actinoplanes sp. SE50/110]ATO86430.1 membrane protein [Actinoplanes sp. SE50]SLM03845.1 membrane protein [Actinoplanes sp. SE50/110]
MSSVDVLPARVATARIAVGVTFAMNGLALAGWLSRAPAVRDGLELSVAGFGLLLLCMSGTSVASIPLAGPLVQRVGPARAVLLASMAMAAGLAVLATATLLGSVVLAGVALLFCGFGTSTWDVAMNVEAADVERRLGRTIMPRFHAGFSLGTVAGAGVGAAASATGVPIGAQLYVTTVIVVAVQIAVVRRFLPHSGPEPGSRPAMTAGQAWREPRTLLIGLILLGFGFTEGSANDWLAISLVDGYHTGDTLGALGFGVFVTAMTLGRMYGGLATDRWGRVPSLRLTALSAAAGILLVVFGGSVWLALAGALCWGVGASLGFPIGMSAAADDPIRAAMRVSVAGSVGYAAFLAGPPLIGFLAEHFGVRNALLCVFAALLLGLTASHAAKPLPTS